MHALFISSLRHGKNCCFMSVPLPRQHGIHGRKVESHKRWFSVKTTNRCFGAVELAHFRYFVGETKLFSLATMLQILQLLSHVSPSPKVTRMHRHMPKSCFRRVVITRRSHAKPFDTSSVVENGKVIAVTFQFFAAHGVFMVFHMY